MTLLSIAVNYPEGSSARAQGGRGLSHHIEGGLRTAEAAARTNGSLGGGGQRPQPGNCSFFPKQGEFSSIHVCEHNDPIPLPNNGLLESSRTMDLREIDFGVEIETVRRTRKRVVSRPSSRWWAARCAIREDPMSSTPGRSSTSRGGQWKVTRRSGAADRRPRRHPPSRRNHPRRPGRKPGLRLLGRTPTPKPKEKRRHESADQEHRPGPQAHPGRKVKSSPARRP